MKATILAAFILGFVMVETERGLSQITGTPSEFADDALGAALWHIAVATQTKIGFESVEFVQLRQLKDVAAFPGFSGEEALKAALDANPRYEWRRMGDFVVVRPKNAWNDARNPFNRPVRNVRVDNATASGALQGLRDFIYTGQFAALPRQGQPVAFNVPSGTILDVLNQLTQSADGVLWNATFRPNAQPDQRFPTWDLKMQITDAERLRTMTESHPPRAERIQ